VNADSLKVVFKTTPRPLVPLKGILRVVSGNSNTIFLSLSHRVELYGRRHSNWRLAPIRVAQGHNLGSYG
jgi:hypothetical protein